MKNFQDQFHIFYNYGDTDSKMKADKQFKSDEIYFF